MAETSCAVYPQPDDGETGSLDDMLIETSSVGTKMSERPLSRGSKVGRRRSFATRSFRRLREEDGTPRSGDAPGSRGSSPRLGGDAGAAGEYQLDNIVEGEEVVDTGANGAEGDEGANSLPAPHARRTSSAPTSAEERLDLFARCAAASLQSDPPQSQRQPGLAVTAPPRNCSAGVHSGEFADPLLQRFAGLHSEQIVHVWTNLAGGIVSPTAGKAAAEALITRGEDVPVAGERGPSLPVPPSA